MLYDINNSLLLIPYRKHIRRQKNEKESVPTRIRFSDISHQKLLKMSPRQEVRHSPVILRFEVEQIATQGFFFIIHFYDVSR